jgi:hypothetical protein
MAFDASRIPADQIKKAREAYGGMIQGRPTASGITDAGGAVDPFDKQHDGSYAVNPWTHNFNTDPNRGNVAITNYKGETESVPFWQADRRFSADLGLTGFEDITNQLNELTARFSDSLYRQTKYGYQNLAEQTDSKFIPMKHGKNDRKQRWG